MPDQPARVVLAIETSQRAGGVALREPGGTIRVEPLSPRKRHDDDLVPAVDRLFAAAGLAPGDLAGVGVSVGPGGFTGLRIAVSSAKMLAMSLGVPVVAVPSALVAAESTPADAGPRRLVALAAKRESFWAATVECGADGWSLAGDGGATDADGADLRHVDAVLGDTHLPEAFLARCRARGLPVIEPRFEPRACLALAERDLAAGRTVDPFALAPLYARPPEAVRLWEARPGSDR